MDDPKLMTSAEVAEMIRVPVPTLASWRHYGKGPRGFRAGRRVLYARDDVLAWIEEQRAADVRVS